jgi:hypothetical protein
LKLSESEDLGYIGMNETIQKKATFLFSPLPLVEEPKDKEEKPNATDVEGNGIHATQVSNQDTLVLLHYP